MDSFILTPLAGSNLVRVQIADGSDGVAHANGVDARGVKSAADILAVVMWQASLDTIPEGSGRDQVRKMRDAYGKRNSSVVA